MRSHFYREPKPKKAPTWWSVLPLPIRLCGWCVSLGALLFALVLLVEFLYLAGCFFSGMLGG